MTLPSDPELEILKLIWRTGPMSAREVQDTAGEDLGWAVSTTRTVLDRMAAKGLLARRSVHGLKVYDAGRGKVEVLGGILRKLARDVLEIDGALPASAFTGSQILSPEDLADLERILNAPQGEDDT